MLNPWNLITDLSNGRGLNQIKHDKGPNTDPYGTPWSRLLLSTQMYCLREVRYDRNQARAVTFNTLLRISHFALDLLKQSRLTGMSYRRITKPHENDVFAHAELTGQR